MKKKTLSLFLVLVMCLTLMPTGVFAQDAASGQTPDQTETAAGSEQQEIPSGGGTENAIMGDQEDLYSVSTFASGNHQHCICGKVHKKIGDHANKELIDFQPWSDSEKLPDKAGNYYLTCNVTLHNTTDESTYERKGWTPESGTTICLNGYSIILDSGNLEAIVIKGGQTFNITDCTGNGSITGSAGHAVSIAGKDSYWGKDEGENTFNMYNANIKNVSSSSIGAGVYISDGSFFNMYGGAVSGNTTNYYAAGIFIGKNAKANIAGGKISDNKAESVNGNYAFGGGIYNKGTLNITEKSIISGNSSSHYGGGIYNSRYRSSGEDYTGECIIRDSSVNDNTAFWYGGGIYNQSDYDSNVVFSGAKLTIENTQISGNIVGDENSSKSAGGGIYISEDDNVNPVNITNSTIKNNKCLKNMSRGSSYGGGIYTEAPLNIKSSQIIGNSCLDNSYGAGIYSYKHGTVSLYSVEITGNKCSSDGKYGAGICIDFPYEKQCLTLDGPVNITKNTCGENKNSNILLSKGQDSDSKLFDAAVSIGNDFQTYSRIGIDVKSELKAGEVRDITDNYYAVNYKDCFTSDNDSYEVISDESNGAYKVQLKSPLPKYTVTIDLGEHAKVVTDTTYKGKATQTVEQGSAMESIKVVPAKGYYFPTNGYSMNGTEVNGVKITQHTDGSKENTGTWLEISGTPSADTTIKLAGPDEARKVADLVPESYEYDGQAKKPALKSGKQDGDTITGDNYTNAGTYKMKVTSQTVFDNDSYEAEIYWTINKKANRMSTISYGLLGDFKPIFKNEDKFEKIRENNTYYTTPYSGSPKIVGIELSDDVTGGGDITVWYKDYKNKGDYTTTPPTKVGVYRVAITMTEGANFKEITRNNIRDIIQFEIEGGYQAPPKGIVGVGPTTEGGNGYLSGTTTDMEYRAYYQDAVESKECKADQTAVSVYDNPDYNVYYVRYKATETLSPSDWVMIVVPKYKPPLSGTVTISGDVKYGSKLTVNVTNANSSDLSYVWKRDGEVIDGATDKTYTLTLDDIGKTISVYVTSSEKNGILTAETSTTVAKLPMDSSVTNAIKAEGYTGSYDGKDHTITVAGVPEGAIVTYGNSLESCNESSAPKYKSVEVGSSGEIITRTVYFKVSIPGYEDYAGSATVKINPVPVTIKINNVTKKVGSDDPKFTATVTGVLDGEKLEYTLKRAEADKDKNSEGDVITIEADYTPDQNYNVKVEKGTLTITEKTPQNIIFAKNSITASPGDTVKNDLTGVQTAVTYTSSNTDVATVADDGTVTVLKLGKTTITANAESTSEYTEATASYELTAKAKVTMVDSGTDAAGAGFYDEKETVTIKAGTRSGYSFTGWTAEPEVTFADASSNETTFEMPAVNVKLTANWKRNSHSSGGSSTPKYTVTAPKSTTGGSVKSDVSSAAGGSTVTVTVTAEEGYKIGGLKVTDSKGNEIKVTDKGNGKYTFTMPSDKVELTPVFTKEAAEVGNELPFRDVAKDAYYYEAVKWAKDNGITGGVRNDLFGSNASCTRGHIVTFLWRNAGSPEPKSTSSFSDVASNSYYAKAVAWAVENGITNGVGHNKFDPDAACTRAQSAAFLYRAIGRQVSSKAHFSDVPSNSYYADAVAWAAANDVTNGIGSGLFGSDNSCTRAQIVTFLYRAYQNRA